MIKKLSRLFSSFSSEGRKRQREWNVVQKKEEIDQVVNRSEHVQQLIFKHSPRCSISSLARGEIDQLSKEIYEKQWELEVHLIDVVRDRKVSDYVEKILKVRHESPQVLLLTNGNVAMHDSHMSISKEDIIQRISQD